MEEKLPVTPADKADTSPLYEQVASDLRRLIESGALRSGDSLPPELDLTASYGVSRHTIRAALAQLEAARLISRSAGRGTFVRSRESPMAFYLDRSFTRHMRETGRQARSDVLRADVGTIGGSDPAPLSDRKEAACFRLSRVRFGDEEPIALQHSVVLTERCGELAGLDWSEQSLYDVLASEFELVVTEIEHAIGIDAANHDQARLLQIGEGDPLLRIVTSSFLEGHEPVESTTSFYPAGRYEYRTVHTLKLR